MRSQVRESNHDKSGSLSRCERMLAVLIVAALLLGACGGNDDPGSADDIATQDADGSQATFAAQAQCTGTPAVTVVPIVTPVPEPTATARAVLPTKTSHPAIASILISSIGVEASVVVLGIDDRGVMQAPDDAWTVAWYGFSAHPLNDGNAVFSGHVDVADVGPAVFWRLSDLVPGDQIQVLMEDGSARTYAVTTMMTIGATVDQETLEQVIGFTPTASVTLITCAGRFDAMTGQYDQRLIVRAEQIPNGD
jgi:LPXTG-site transpeptidase (sortase) family protein